MRAVLVQNPGNADQLKLGEHATPRSDPDELLIKVAAAGINRADIFQRQGNYPPPPGASSILGLEVAGVVEAVGSEVKDWKPGDRICALLSGGGYAEYAVVPQELAMRIPNNLTMTEAAAIPEAFLTAFQALHWLGGMQEGYHVLIHAGASGVGTAAIQLVRHARASAHVTAGSPEKLKFCLALGAKTAINYKNDRFADKVYQTTGGFGANIVIDVVGAPYWSQNVKALAVDGRIICLSLMGGKLVSHFDFSKLFRKRGQLITSTLRSRGPEYKAQLIEHFAKYALPLFEKGELKPIVDRIFDWSEVAQAHEYMEANRNIGKLILRVSD